MSSSFADEPKVAIVVPIFNAERYICDCMLSLSKQTHSNFKVFMINDGSTDSTLDIVNGYIIKDNRFTIISQSNQGVARARNVGLQEIENDGSFQYVCFIDSDDVYKENYLESLVFLSQKNNADLTVCGYYLFNEDGLIEDSSIPFHKQMLDYDELVSLIFGVGKGAARIGSGGYSWKHMFKSSLVHGLRFPEGNICEDEYFNLKAASKARSISYTSDRLYGYRVRSNSMVHSKEFSEMLLKGRILCLKLVQKASDKAYDVVIVSVITSLIECYKNNYGCSVNLNYLEKDAYSVYKKKMVSRKVYLRWLLILYFPRVASKVFFMRDLFIKLFKK